MVLSAWLLKSEDYLTLGRGRTVYQFTYIRILLRVGQENGLIYFGYPVKERIDGMSTKRFRVCGGSCSALEHQVDCLQDSFLSGR